MRVSVSACRCVPACVSFLSFPLSFLSYPLVRMTGCFFPPSNSLLSLSLSLSTYLSSSLSLFLVIYLPLSLFYLRDERTACEQQVRCERSSYCRRGACVYAQADRSRWTAWPVDEGLHNTPSNTHVHTYTSYWMKEGERRVEGVEVNFGTK